MTSSLPEPSNFFSRWFHSESTPSAFSTKLEDLTKLKDYQQTTKAQTFKSLASACVFVHFVFGTLVFSSTLFIGTLDALGIVGRYLASALLCRIVILLEIGGIKGVKEAEKEAKNAGNPNGQAANNSSERSEIFEMHTIGSGQNDGRSRPGGLTSG